MVEQEIRPVVFRYETAKVFSRAAKEAGKTVHIHIGLDTGMHRIGFSGYGGEHRRDPEDSAVGTTWSWKESSLILPGRTRQIRHRKEPSCSVS